MTAALVVAPAWPPELPPVRLVRALTTSGAQVTVAAEERARKLFEAAGADMLALPGSGSPSAGTVLGVGSSGVRALRSSTTRSALAAAAAGSSGRQRMQALWRLLPLAVQPWDEIYLPAEADATAYLPALRLASRGVVVVDRPPRAEGVADLFRAATEVRCASTALARSASACGATEGSLSVAALPPPDPDVFRPGGPRASGRLRLACTAPFHWSGGHDYLLAALRRLLDGGLDFACDLVDDGPEPQRLLYTIVDLGLAEFGPDGRPRGDRITVHRRPTFMETADVLRRSDVVVLAAVEDRPWPELSEALACGLPVVATQLPSIAEMLPDRGPSLVPPRDPDALAAALASVAGRLSQGAS